MMFLSLSNVIIMGLGYLILAIWLFFYIKGRKYNSMFSVLDEKEFYLKEIYGVGYAVIQVFHYDFKSKKDRKLRQEAEVLYGEKYVDYYLRVNYARKITISSLLLVLSFIFYGLANDITVLIVMLFFSGLSYFYFGNMMTKQVEKRSDEILQEFSEVVSKLALLTNAGMILKEAWISASKAGDGVIYQEMRKTVEDMDNGMADVDAYHAFGRRCMLPEIKKFSSTIIQGVQKGNSELAMVLQQQSKEVWELKRQLAKRKGEKAASELMIPIFLMFFGVLVMILVPIFTNLGA